MKKEPGFWQIIGTLNMVLMCHKSEDEEPATTCSITCAPRDSGRSLARSPLGWSAMECSTRESIARSRMRRTCSWLAPAE